MIHSSDFPKAGEIGDKQRVVLGCQDSVSVLEGMPRVSGMEGAWSVWSGCRGSLFRGMMVKLVLEMQLDVVP